MGTRRHRGGFAPRADTPQARESCQLRAKAQEVDKAGVRRLVKAGLSDNQVSKVLRMTPTKVAEYREQLALPPNPPGGAFD